MDEFRFAIAYQARHGFPSMPDQPAPGPGTRGANWARSLSMREAVALDEACAEGARNNYFIGSIRAGRIPTGAPDVEQSLRDAAAYRARQTAEADRERAAWRERIRKEDARAQAEADAADFANRVAIEAARRIAALKEQA